MIDTWMYNSRGNNGRAVRVGSLTVFFSYDTIVAFRDGEGLKVRENDWGPTTGRHLADIDGGDREAKKARLTSSEFNKELEEAYYRAGLKKRLTKDTVEKGIEDYLKS